MAQRSTSRSGPEDNEVRRATQVRTASQEGGQAVSAAGADDAAAGADATDPVLRFEPEKVVCGIAFHVVDEGLGREVEPESAKRAVARLRRASCRPAIRRSSWLAMTHEDRLDWLLAASRIIPLVRDDDVVLLSAKEV
jgi:hypothetical protein